MPPGSASLLQASRHVHPVPIYIPVPSSTMMSPRLMPIRSLKASESLLQARIGDASASWTPTAHRTASTGLENSTRKPSPVVLKIRP